MVDEQAMLALASGDLDKAAVLYERYKRAVLGYFYRNSIKHDYAEDLMQQVFFRVINYRNSFNEGYSFKPWLFRIARNVLNDHFQKNKNVFSEIQEDIEDDVNDQQEEQERDLKRALQKLPAEYREVIMLSRYEELKYDEIAELLQISVSLVKVRVHRGLKILREIYFQIG